ncbi:MAG: type II secretion system F family protein [Anaerolineaceae bacterium]|nr:type II secretion system F family protein [Anaerolineaceae bacterium]
MPNPIIILAIGGGLAIIMLLVGIVSTVSTDKSAVEERLGQYIDQETQEEMERIKRTPLTDWVNTKVEGSERGERIAKSLARADIKMRPGEYIGLLVIAALGAGFVFYIIGGRYILVGLLGCIVGFFLPGMYVKRQQSQRLIKFDNQLGDMLNLMVNGLRAGFSTMQAMEAVSKELPPPICDEFHRVVQEMQLGIPMERTLDNLLRRIPSNDLDLVITAINVQREVGGNLAEILDTISFTIRERVRIKGEIRVLTTQASYSGKMLSFMPLGVMGILYLMNRPYMMEFFMHGACGYVPLGIAGILIALGSFVMGKMADVDI